MNIKEIASRAEVSVATVSRVLNHPETVAPKTRERILALIDEIGYKPNWFARGLNFNKTNTIGLLIPNILDPAYVEIAEGAEEVANKKGYNILLCITEGVVDKEKQYIRTLIDRMIDGIVLVSSLLEDDDVQDIKRQGTPLVLVGENRGNSSGPIVRIDCKDASFKAVVHLVDSGHQRIAMIFGSMPAMENQRKIEGYMQALHKARLPVKPEFVVEAENTIEGGYVATRRLISLDPKPQAIFCSSDILAFGALDAIRDSDQSVPEDVAVMGFDNVRMSSLMVPKLSTVSKPLHRMGLSGARLLLDVIESKDSGEAVMEELVLQSKLKIRKSCGHKERINEIF